MGMIEQTARAQERAAILAQRPDVIRDLERRLASDQASDALAAHGAAQNRSSLTSADVESLASGTWAPDDRLISHGRLFVDCRNYARNRTKGVRKADVELVASLAASHVIEHCAPTIDRDAMLGARLAAAAQYPHSRERRILDYIGRIERLAADANQAMPLRRDWLDSDNRPTDAAIAQLRRAVKWAVSTYESGEAPLERPMEGESLAAAAERMGADADTDVDNPLAALADARADQLAAVLALPVEAARAIEHDAIVARLIADGQTAQDAAGMALDLISARDKIARSGIPAMVSRGHKVIGERYPEPRDLLAALRDGCDALRAMAADRLSEECEALIDGYGDIGATMEALSDYIGARRGMSPMTTAIERACIQRLIREGNPAGYAIERASLIARCIRRLVPAELQRARVQGNRRIVTTGTGSTDPATSKRVVRSGGYGKRAARIYVRRAATMQLTRDARMSMRRLEVRDRMADLDPINGADRA